MGELRNQKRLKQILELRQKGLTQPAIADKLGIHISTVRYYLFLHVREQQNKAMKKWLKNNPEKSRECNRRWQKKNPDYLKKHYKEHPELYKEKLKRNRERLKNMTPKEKEKFRKHRNEYYRNRYHTDKKFRAESLSKSRKYQKRSNYYMNRYHSDPEFRARVLASITKYQKRMRAEGNLNFLTKRNKYTQISLRRKRFRDKFKRIGYNQADILNAQETVNFEHKDYSLRLINHLANIPDFLRVEVSNANQTK